MTKSKATPLGEFPEGLRSSTKQLEPFDWYRRQRSTGPIHYDETRDCYDVFGYEAVKSILEDPNTFSSNPTILPNNKRNELEPISSSMLFRDPPRHDVLRSTIDDFFISDHIRNLKPMVKSTVEELLRDIENTEQSNSSANSFDLVERVAFPLPISVVIELLGVSEERRWDFRRWSVALMRASTGPFDRSQVSKQRSHASKRLREYFQDLLQQRRENPQDDVLSAIALAEELTHEEKVGTCTLLLVAGHATTTQLITNTIWCLEEENLFGALYKDPTRLKRLIEEVLRYRSPFQAIQRWTRNDMTVAGTEIPEESSIVLWLGSANRDPTVFDKPEQFNPKRNPTEHLAFGHGIHYCLGAELARLMAKSAIRGLLSRFSNLQSKISDLEPTKSMMIYGPQSLQTHYDGNS